MNDLVDQANGGREIAQHEGGGLSDGAARFALLKQALIDPNVQPEKASAMADLMFKMEDRDRQTRFIAAKVAAIAAMPRIVKDGKSNHGAYSTWEQMQPRITAVLTGHGLALNFDIGQTDKGQVTVAPILSGYGWEERGSAIVLPADTSGSKNNVQAVGSAVKYGQRYAAMAMLNIVTGGVPDDDDGNAAGGTALDAYEQLTPPQKSLVDEGRAKAHEGFDPYQEWFKALSAQERGFLTFNQAWPSPKTWHDQNKDLVAKVG